MGKPCRGRIQSVFITLIVFLILIVAGVPAGAAEKKDSLANVHGILQRQRTRYPATPPA